MRTKGSLSATTAKLMVFKLAIAAAKNWRRLKGENQLPKVVQGVRFHNGIEVIEIRFIADFGIDLDEQHDDVLFTERETEALNLAVLLMQAEGMVEVGETYLDPQHGASQGAKPNSES